MLTNIFKQNIKKIIITLIGISILSFASCAADEDSATVYSKEKGSLHIRLPQSSRVAPVEADIAKYVLTLESNNTTDPEEQTVDAIDFDDPIKFEGLFPGVYTLTANAYDSEGRLLFVGTKTGIIVDWADVITVDLVMQYAPGSVYIDFVFPDPDDLPWANAYSFDTDFEPIFIGDTLFNPQTNEQIFAGTVGTGFNDLFVITLDNAGEKKSEFYYKDPAGDNLKMLTAINTSDGGMFIIYYKYEDSTPDSGSMGFLKIDTEGELKYNKILQDITISEFVGVNVIQLLNNNLLISFFNMYSDPDTRMDVIRLDENLNFIDANSFSIDPAFQTDIGTFELEVISSVEDSSGNITLAFDSDQFDDVYLLKLNLNLEVQWLKSYDGGEIDSLAKIRLTEDGDYIVCGSTQEVAGDRSTYKGFLMKLDADGVIKWQNKYSVIHNEREAVSVADIIVTNDNGYFISGSLIDVDGSNHEIFASKLNEDGSLEWSTRYGTEGLDLGFASAEISTGGFMIQTFMESYTTMLKIDSFGNIPGLSDIVHVEYLPTIQEEGIFDSQLHLDNTEVTKTTTTPSIELEPYILDENIVQLPEFIIYNLMN